LILGTTDHAPHGLMRATWTANEIRRAAPVDWIFTSEQGDEMRRRLVERDRLSGEDMQVTTVREEPFVRD
ncbi:MAG TPA: hypothetical protein VLV86_26015, partial [Vicinamibacterales bacterium]|nr:hypothetical protein [Vicinamibacterales bacterium]